MTNDEKNEQIKMIAEKYAELALFMVNKKDELRLEDNMAQLAMNDFYQGFMWMREAVFSHVDQVEAAQEVQAA